MAYLVTKRKMVRVSRPRRRRGMGDAIPNLIGSFNQTLQATTAAPTVVTQCSADGMFILDGGVWRRLKAGETCTGLPATGGPSRTSVHNADGSVTTTYGDGHVETTAPPGSDTVVLQPTDKTIVQDGIILAPTEGTPITYQWTAIDPTMFTFTQAQRAQMLAWLLNGAASTVTGQGGMGVASTVNTGGCRLADYLPVNISSGAFRDQFFPCSVLKGQWPVKKFSLDGDDKIVLATVTNPNPLDQAWTDHRNEKPRTITLVWQHNKTLFQAVDDFLTSLSPISTEELCSLIPVASKVPNPYAIAGSMVLQMSGKCPPTCPAGMTYDATSKQCSCPPGSYYDASLQRCVVAQGSLDLKSLLPVLLVGGAALLAISLISGSGSKKKAHPP